VPTFKTDHCRLDSIYLKWRARCLVLSGRARAAWELYAAAQAAGQAAAVGEAGYALLHLIGDDCYRMGSFYYAAKVGSPLAMCSLWQELPFSGRI
jgi:intraflagellar transport protein 56